MENAKKEIPVEAFHLLADLLQDALNNNTWECLADDSEASNAELAGAISQTIIMLRELTI